MLFSRRSHRRRALSMDVDLVSEEIFLHGQSRDVSLEGLCLIIPSVRVKVSILDLLEKDVTIACQNETLQGRIKWYTMEEASYLIGIAIIRPDRRRWRKIIPPLSKGLFH